MCYYYCNSVNVDITVIFVCVYITVNFWDVNFMLIVLRNAAGLFVSVIFIKLLFLQTAKGVPEKHCKIVHLYLNVTSSLS